MCDIAGSTWTSNKVTDASASESNWIINLLYDIVDDVGIILQMQSAEHVYHQT